MTLSFTAAGLQIDTVAEAAEAIANDLKTRFGQTLQTGNPNTVVANYVASAADTTVTVQEGLQAVYSQLTVTGATGVSLDTLGLLVGNPRNLATQTLGTMTVTNASASPVAIPQGASWQNADTQELYATVSAQTVGASTTATVAIRAVDTGPQTVGTAVYNVLSSFAGAVSLSAVGLATTSQGTAQETDGDYRLRLISDGALAGSGTLASILAAVRAVDGVTRAVAYENTSNATGITTPVIIAGLPGHSFVVVAEGGDTDEIAAAIYSKAPAAIQMYGDTTVNVDTGEGYTTPVTFERPAALTIYVSATITGASSDYNDAVEASIIAYLAGYPATVLYNRVLCSILDALPVTANISALTMGTTVSPVATANIVVPWNEYPTATSVSIVLSFV